MKSYIWKRLAICLMVCVLVHTTQAQNNPQRVVVAYVTSWSTVMPDPTRMTHINYAFAHVNSSLSSISIDNVERLKQIVKLKEVNPQLKVVLSLGGGGGSQYLHELAANATKRQQFGTVCKNVCQQYNLDGIDVDWEFPDGSGDKTNYTLLMKAMKEGMGNDLLLTMASADSPSFYNYRDFIQYMDFINVMAYNMAGEGNHHAALYRGGTVSSGGSCWNTVNESITAHLNAGIPAGKLVLGMPFYANNGKYTGDSEISYQRIKNYMSQGYTRKWDDVGKVPYLVDGSGRLFYCFDDAESITLKCNYILNKNLLGGMYWEYDEDDNLGTLRNTVYTTLIGASQDDEKLYWSSEEMMYIGYRQFAVEKPLRKGTTYQISGATEVSDGQLWVDHDFFEDNGNGRLTFRAIDGNYRVTVNLMEKTVRVMVLDANGNPTTLQSNGTGTVWVIGGTGIGKPNYTVGGYNWQPENGGYCMAPVSEKVYQTTLTVGEQLNAADVNFKFFHQQGWGGEFTGSGSNGSHLTCNSDVFGVGTGSGGHDDGNIYLKAGNTLKAGDSYTFTIDCTSGISNAQLSVSNTTTGIATVTTDQDDEAYYTLQGIKVLHPTEKGVYIHHHRKVIYGGR